MTETELLSLQIKNRAWGARISVAATEFEVESIRSPPGTARFNGAELLIGGGAT